jgi:polyketide cyclase/dehydrase/lipid transport protein
MAHYKASLDTPRPLEEMFAYLSDFSTTQEWDPGVIEAERLGEGPVREGTEFRLLARSSGERFPSSTALSNTSRQAQSRSAARARRPAPGSR